MEKKSFLVICAQPEETDGFFYQREKKLLSDNLFLLEEETFKAYVSTGGIGKAAIAFSLGKLLSEIKIDFIINTGVAGSLDKDMKPCETFVSEKCAYYDVDVTAFGYQYGQMCGQPLYYLADEKAVKIARQIGNDQVKTGLILSGDKFITSTNMPKEIYSKFDQPLAIDMESAAVAQCANMASIPFLIIRTISDDPNKEIENQDTYTQRLNETCRYAGDITYQIIKKLCE